MACVAVNTPNTSSASLRFECSTQSINHPMKVERISPYLGGDRIDNDKTPEKIISAYIVTAFRNVAISFVINLLSFVLTIAFFLKNKPKPDAIEPVSAKQVLPTENQAKEKVESLAKKLKDSAGDVDASVVRDKFTKLGLIKSDGGWYSDKIEALGEKLLKDVDGRYVESFIDRTVKAAEANELFNGCSFRNYE